jgi:tetratricopeptide (TPR) repeat protein
MMMDPASEGKLGEAVAAHRGGRLDDAEKLYRIVLQLQPNHADACALLGVVVGARGDFPQAVELVNRAVELDPNSGLLRFHQGSVLMAAQILPQAIEAFRRALVLQPGMAQIHFNFANALRAANDWTGAIAQYREALRLDDKFLDAYNNLALSLVHEQQYGEAMQLALKSVSLDPTFGDGWLTACNIAEKIKEYEAALKAGKRAVDLMPGNHYSWFGYGVALNRLGRDEEAIAAYQQALKLNPRRVNIWDNLAQTYQSLNRLDEAEAAFHKAVDIAGQTIEDEEERLAEGREINENEYGNRHWHLALMELLRGNYVAGFARYRSRFKEIKELVRQDFPFPLWKGEDLYGKTLLVCDEQGYGDTLMLARFLPLVRARGAQVIFTVHKVLKPLFASWGGADLVLANGETIPPCDYFCSSFDLPHRLGITLENLPHDVPYLPVLPLDGMTQLDAATGRKIGVVWGGSPLHLNDGKRSVPLKVFAGMFSVPDFKFYSFNRDLKPGDIELLPDYPVENLVPRLTDFAAAARLIGQMDLIITVDTATAHLAGGLGKPVWVLLPFAPDWRWLTERSDSPWYPNARLFRQPKGGDWPNVILEVKQALAKL